MNDKEKEKIFADIRKMDNIFQRIFDKYKINSESYISKDRIKELIHDSKKNKTQNIEYIEKDIYYTFNFPFLYISTKEEKFIYINFLVYTNFITEDKETFSFWVCSYEYLKQKLNSLGYSETKLIKTNLFLNKKENEINDNDSNNSSSESLEDKINIDAYLMKYKILVSDNKNFNFKDIFKESQEVFDPFVDINNIGLFRKDLNISKSIDITKIKFSENYITNLNDYIFRDKNNIFSYYYNEKSGLTFSLIQILEKLRQLSDFRYFYFNAEKVDKYKIKYLSFNLAKIFKKEEEKIFLDLLTQKDGEIINYNIEYIIKILNETLKQFDNIYIIFDNIKSNNALKRTMYIANKLDSFKYTFLLFISINSETLSLINNLKSTTYKVISLFPGNLKYKQELPPEDYFKSLISKNKEEYVEIYKQNIKTEVYKFNDDTIDYFIFLIKLLHNDKFLGGNNLIKYNDNDYLKKFLPYIYISINTNTYIPTINKIQFRTPFIKDAITAQFNLLLTKNLLTDNIFSDIKTKSNEGIYIEKEIIYHLITKIITLNVINIDKIYSFNNSFEQKFINQDLIFLQKLESAPIYDFGIVKCFNGEITFKGYQIGINKPYTSLLHLYKEKIKMDMLYFISKINMFLDKKITKFTFGIITTTYAYDCQKNNNISNNDNDNEIDIENNEFQADNNKEEKKEENDNDYKNYTTMKNYCNNNNYEFILFNPKDKGFFIDNNNTLEIIDFNDYYNEQFGNDITNFLLKKEGDYYLTKLSLFPQEIVKSDIEYINRSIIGIKDKQLNFVGKFRIKQIGNYKEINFNDLINDNYLIYAKNKKNGQKTLFFKKNYVCNDYKEIEIFYVFDTSLNKNIKGRKKKDNKLELEELKEIITDTNKSENENNEIKMLKKKKKRQKNKKYEKNKQKKEKKEKKGKKSK